MIFWMMSRRMRKSMRKSMGRRQKTARIQGREGWRCLFMSMGLGTAQGMGPGRGSKAWDILRIPPMST